MKRTMRHLQIVILSVLLLITALSGCGTGTTVSQQPQSPETDLPQNEQPSESVVQEPSVNPSEIYTEAVHQEEDGSRLQAMSLFMQIYKHEDAFSRYMSLSVDKRIDISGGTSSDTFCFISDSGRIYSTSDFRQLESDDAWTGLVELSSHDDGLIGLKSDGTVIATEGHPSHKWYSGAELVSEWSDLIDIACGSYHTLGLKSDGTVLSTEYIGKDDYNKGQYNVSDWKDIVMIAAGETHSLGLKSDGTVVACGNNEYGQCDVETWTDIVQIDADSYYSVGLKSDGTVVIAGNALFGAGIDKSVISTWSNLVSVSVGPYHIVGLKSDGTAIASGSNNNGECNVEDWADLCAIVAGSSRTMGVASDGSIMLIGNGSNMDGAKQIKVVNFFTLEEQKLNSLEKPPELPDGFPEEIPMYQNSGIVKTSVQKDATVVVFETSASFDDAFSYYEKWCSDRGGYLKTPYNGSELDMLITPLHDIQNAVTIVVTKGIEDDKGNLSENCAVILMLQGGNVYDSVKNLK